MKQGLQTHIKTLNESSPAPFDEDPIENYSSLVKDMIFLPNEESVSNAEIPLNKVVGHSQMYGPSTWKCWLRGLKRIERNLEQLATHPDYYIGSEEKRGMSFIEVDGKYYIVAGKHRTVIARYFAFYNQQAFPHGATLKGVSLVKRTVDVQLMEYRYRLQILLEQNKYRHLNWSFIERHNSDPLVRIQNRHRKGEVNEFGRGELSGLIEALETHSFVKRVIGNKFHKLISQPLV